MKQINRRDFLIGMAAGLSPLAIGYYKLDKHIENVMDDRDLREGEFLQSLEEFVIEAETKITFGKEIKDIKGMGVVHKNYYFTLSHIVDYSEGIPTRTPFGMMTIKPKDLKFSTNIKGVDLENVVMNKENDVSVFKIPEHLRVNEFPLEIRERVSIGERVAILGNPALSGYHARIGRITDIDGIIINSNELKDDAYKNSIGTDINVVPGDSGTPVISMRDKKLVGIMGLRFGGMSYFQPIKEFLKYVK